MLRVLVVCTANVCRSPLVETLLRSRTSGSPVMLDSAGTAATPGDPFDRRLDPFLDALDIPRPEHEARGIGDIRLERRDLVLTAERRHRREVVQRDPRLSKRTFTVIEFARLLDAVDVDTVLRGTHELGDRERLDVLLRRLGKARSATLAGSPADDDLADPHGRASTAYRTCVRRADEATEVVARALRAVVVR